MKPIKVKDLKVGDWIRINHKTDKERRFMIRIRKINVFKGEIGILYFYFGNMIKDIIYIVDEYNCCVMKNYDWEHYNIWKATKKEYYAEVKNENMLKELEK